MRRKRGVIASEADVPFLSAIAAVLGYHLLPALPCRPPPVSTRELAERVAWHSSPFSEVPHRGASREGGDHCRKAERRSGLCGHASEGEPSWPTCGVRRCDVGHYVPTSFGSPAAIASWP